MDVKKSSYKKLSKLLTTFEKKVCLLSNRVFFPDFHGDVLL